MKPLRVLAAAALCGAVALAFAGWLAPDNAFALASALAFCQ
ncbi:hypothetical protein [Azospira restricta]|nr:hypothetical protein [Azospira restricta]